MIKLIGFDLDDTLLDDKKEIKDKKAIIELINKGIKVCFCSGRPLVNKTKEYYQELGLYHDDVYYVGYNGVTVQEVKTEKVIYENNLTNNDINFIYQAFYKYLDSDYVIYSHFMNKVYADGFNEYLNIEAKYNDIPIIKKKFWLDKDFTAHKIMIASSPEKIKKLFDLIEKDIKPYYNIMISLPCFIEVLPKNADKFSGITQIGKIYGIKEDEIMTFGDSMNDYTFIKKARIGIAMGNSIEEVKKVSKYVTLDNNNYGITKALEYFKNEFK